LPIHLLDLGFQDSDAALQHGELIAGVEFEAIGFGDELTGGGFEYLDAMSQRVGSEATLGADGVVAGIDD